MDEFRKLNIDRMLAEHELDRRQHLRVRPSMQNPIHLISNEHHYRVHDISQGGISFISPDPPGLGWRLQGLLKLPGRQTGLLVNLLVVGVLDEGVVRCQFEGLAPEDLREIAAYVSQRRGELTHMLLGGLTLPNNQDGSEK